MDQVQSSPIVCQLKIVGITDGRCTELNTVKSVILKRRRRQITVVYRLKVRHGNPGLFSTQNCHNHTTTTNHDSERNEQTNGSENPVSCVSNGGDIGNFRVAIGVIGLALTGALFARPFHGDTSGAINQGRRYRNLSD